MGPMSELVRNFDLGTKWEPDDPRAVLVASDIGETRLTLRAHFDDPDQRSVVLVWLRSWATRMEPPNDEALSGHSLYRAGLREVVWIGEVVQSRLIAHLEKRNRFDPLHDPQRFRQLRHWVVPLKEVLVEVVAEEIELQRAWTP
jgi:hypothetical protein